MRLVVIAYHHITAQESTVSSRLYMSVAKFEEHIQHLVGSKMPFVSTRREIENLQGAQGTAVMLTFDDAYENFYRLAFPVLKKFGVPGVLFVPTAKVGLRVYEPDYGCLQEYVTLRQLRAMQKSELVTIQPHGHSHAPLGGLSDNVQAEEIKLSMSYLKLKLGIQSDLFCLPYGAANETTMTLLKEAGIRYVFTTNDGDNLLVAATNVQPVPLNRYAFKSTMSVNCFREALASPGMTLYPTDASDRRFQD